MRHSTPEQERAIRNMMVGRKLTLRHPGPRTFPKYKPGMSTVEYVKLYRFANVNYSCFKQDDIVFHTTTTTKE